MQEELFFFDIGELPPSREERQWVVSKDNPDCPLNSFIGNAKAVDRLRRMAFCAFERYNHCCADLSVALIGPASTGKTTLAKLFAKTVGLPFIEIHPREISNSFDILTLIQESLPKWELELTLLESGFVIPSSIIFIDEVHALRKPVIDALLKPTENNDGIMLVKDPKTKHIYNVNCLRVCWFIATTERGELPAPFDSRFTKVLMSLYTQAEVAGIIRHHKPHLSENVCLLIASFAGLVPREALDFATEVELEQKMSGLPWEQVVHRVRKDNNIDEFGMSEQRLNILRALRRNGPIPMSRLSNVAHCKEEELKRYVLPPLFEYTRERDALISMSNRGCSLTKAGLKELEKRNESKAS